MLIIEFKGTDSMPTALHTISGMRKGFTAEWIILDIHGDNEDTNSNVVSRNSYTKR